MPGGGVEKRVCCVLAGILTASNTRIWDTNNEIAHGKECTEVAKRGVHQESPSEMNPHQPFSYKDN